MPSIPVGKYLSMTAATSCKGIFSLMKARIRKKISKIAIKNTKEENLLKNITTIIHKTTNTIKSIYIHPPLYDIFIVT